MECSFLSFCQGESFYNPFIPGVLEKLSNLGLVEESKGARVIFIEGINIPLIVVKSDGGYNYASTDLTALWLVFFNNQWLFLYQDFSGLFLCLFICSHFISIFPYSVADIKVNAMHFC